MVHRLDGIDVEVYGLPRDSQTATGRRCRHNALVVGDTGADRVAVYQPVAVVAAVRCDWAALGRLLRHLLDQQSPPTAGARGARADVLNVSGTARLSRG
jgi:hypothetical protein